MAVRTKLTESEQHACWQEYCQTLAAAVVPEAALAAHWDKVFALLDGSGFAEQSAAEDATEFAERV